MTLYDEFKEHAKEAAVIRQSSKGLSSNNPNERGASRSNLEAVINNRLGPRTVTKDTADSNVLAYTPNLERYLSDIAVGRLKRDPSGIMDSAINEFRDRLKDGYLLIQPVQIGNAEHDRIVAMHVPYYLIERSLEELNPEDKKSFARFLDITTGAIVESVKQLLADPDASADDIERLANLAGQSYRTASSEDAVLRANYVAARIRNRIENALPENGRYNYASANLRKAAEIISDTSQEQNIRDGYAISITRDLVKII